MVRTGRRRSRGGQPRGHRSRPETPEAGRIVSGAATGARTGEWLTPGHRRAKTITNCVANRWGDGPDTPAGVRDRAARQDDPSPQDLLARIDDQTIAMAIRGVRDLEQRWLAVPPGGTLRLCWPLARDFFAEPEKRSPGAGPMTRASTAQNVQFDRGHAAELPHPSTAHIGYRAAPAGRSTTLCDQCQVQMSRRVGIAGGHGAFLTA